MEDGAVRGRVERGGIMNGLWGQKAMMKRKICGSTRTGGETPCRGEKGISKRGGDGGGRGSNATGGKGLSSPESDLGDLFNDHEEFGCLSDVDCAI